MLKYNRGDAEQHAKDISLLLRSADFFPQLLEMYSFGELSVFAGGNLIQSCKISEIDVTHVVVPAGDGGDESHPSDPGLHVLL